MIINSQIPTKIELNGPILSFITQPTSNSKCSGESVTFTGLATATFPVQSPENPAENSGYISYRWYEVGVGALSDGGSISGSGTTVLTISNLRTPTDHSRQFYLKADYVHSAYALPQGSTVTVGTAKSTGNALNDGLDSNTVTLTVYPNINVVRNPSGQTVTQTKIATFNAEGSLTDSRQGDLAYNWQLNDQDINDGVISSTDQQVDQTYTSDATITLPADAQNIVVSVAGAGGGNGGNDPPPGNDPTAPPALGGGGGRGAVGVFRFPNGQRTLTFRVGKKGGDGVTGTRGGYGYPGQGGSSTIAAGGSGGGSGGVDPPVPAGQGGAAWSGGGAGGGGASSVHDSVANSVVIVASGGGGGGGGSWNMPGGKGEDADPLFTSTTGQFESSAGQAGVYPGPNVDGGGGGGGGGGSLGGEGGNGGRDNNFPSEGGKAGESKYSSNRVELFDGSLNAGDGYINLRFTTKSAFPGVTGDRVTNTIVRGSKTPTLTIESDNIGEYFVRAKLTHPTACNSPRFTESARYSIVSARQIINVEFINQSAGVLSGSASYNLFTTPSVTFDGSNVTGLICLYAAERDVNVIMECYASKGQDNNGYPGGQGGVSTIKFTMRAGEEYIINNIPQANNSGAIFMYRQERLIVTVAAGGNAGSGGAGGAGGGINVAGAPGEGRGAGAGGSLYQAGTLAFPGIFGSAARGLTGLLGDDSVAPDPLGGRIIPCPRGGYWYRLGYAPCQRMGRVPFYNADGVLIPGASSTIERGFKAGYGIRNTAGRGINGGGTGGNGATGGNGGDGGGGGGGGSGYNDGSVTVLSTQLGGNSGQPRVVLRLGDLL